MNARPLRRWWAAFLACLAATAFDGAAQQATPAAAKPFEPQVGQAGKDVIWVPTPDEVVQKMLELAQVRRGERVVDLGSGDGKIAIAAAHRGAIARGIEYNPDMVEVSKRNAEKAGVKVDFVRGDIFESKFTEADVVTLYLLPTLNERLRPILLAMKPGTRVTSHAFRMGDWEPDDQATVSGREAFLWLVPANIQGRWATRLGNGAGPALSIKQAFQKIEGDSEWNGRATLLRDAKVEGPHVSFVFADEDGGWYRFEGAADHTGPVVGVARPLHGGHARLFTATRR